MAVSEINAKQSAFVARTLLMTGKTQDIYGDVGAPPVPRRDGVPAHSSTTCKWRRYENLSTTPKVLTRGVTPEAGAFTYTDLTVTLTEFGDYVVIDNISVDTVEDPVLAIAGQRQGEQSINWLNQIRLGQIIAGTNRIYTAGTQRTDVTALISATFIEKATRSLNLNKARKFTKQLSASQGYNTTPIPASYIGFCSSYVAYDIRNTIGESNGFVPPEKYSKTDNMHPNEIGKVGLVRFREDPDQEYFADAGGNVTSGHKTTSTVKEDVFCTIICGEEAYGIVPFLGTGKKNDGVKAFVETAGGTNDPLHQRNTSGWRTMQGAKILNDDWMVTIESGATA